MSIQPEIGTQITVLSTKPDDPTVKPLVILTIGDTSRVMSLNEASTVAADLRSKVRGDTGSVQKIILKSGDAEWGMSFAAALRIATALENEVFKVQTGSNLG